MSTRVLVSRRLMRWVAWIGLSMAISLEAARVDPDFRPLFGFGFDIGEGDSINAVMPDGRVILPPGYVRWMPDGSVDASYTPSEDGRRRVQAMPSGQLVGHYENESPQVVWLDSGGRRTSVGLELNREPFESSGTLYPYLNDQYMIFGDFESVNGINRSRLARINADGSVDTLFDPGFVSSDVWRIWVQADGKILLSGWFTEYGGVEAPGLVRLNVNGTIDGTFTPDSPVHDTIGSTLLGVGPVADDSEGRILRAFRGAIYRSDASGMSSQLLVEYEGNGSIFGFVPLDAGAFLVFGEFLRINDVNQSYLVRIREDGLVDQDFNAGSVLGLGPTPQGRLMRRVERMADGRLVPFVRVGLRLLADGSVDSSFQPAIPAQASVEAVAIQPDGKIVVGGVFTHIDGIARTGLARLNPDGTIDPSFDPGNDVAIGEIRSIAMGDDGEIWVGGGPLRETSERQALVSRHLSDGSIDPDVQVDLGEDSLVRTIAVDDQNRVSLGGRFSVVNGLARNGLARLNVDHTVDVGFAEGVALSGAGVDVTHLENMADGRLLVAGAFDAWRGQRRWGVLTLTPEGELDGGFDPGDATAGLSVVAAGSHPDNSVAVACIQGAAVEEGQESFVHLLDPSGKSRAEVKPSLDDRAEVTALLAGVGTRTLIGVVPNERYFTFYPPYVSTMGPNGERDFTFVPETGGNAVKAMAGSPDGSIVLVGDFVGFDGMPFANLVRVVGMDPPMMPRLADISTRGAVGPGERQLIAGFVVEGTEPQRVMIRGVGPTLEEYGIENALVRPFLKVYADPAAPPLAQGGFWWEGDRYGYAPSNRALDMFERFGAFDLTGGIPPSGLGGGEWDLDAVMVLDLEPGAYTVQLSGENTGIGLVEVYNATGVEADRRIVNLSTRGWVGVGDDRLLGGFVIDRGPRRVLVRAVGPKLDDFGVSGYLEDPRMRLVRTVEFTEVAANDNWEDGGAGTDVAAAAETVGAFALDSGSLDAALVLDLEPGAYTAIVSGVDDTTGVALVEVYELPEVADVEVSPPN